MSNIAKELRERSLRAEQEGEPLSLLDDAADEIERLRLTDEEREAIELAAMEYEARASKGVGLQHSGPTECGEQAAILRALLARLT